MIKLFSLKQQKKDEVASGGKRKATAAQLRLTKGIYTNLLLCHKTVGVRINKIA